MPPPQQTAAPARRKLVWRGVVVVVVLAVCALLGAVGASWWGDRQDSRSAANGVTTAVDVPHTLQQPTDPAGTNIAAPDAEAAALPVADPLAGLRDEAAAWLAGATLEQRLWLDFDAFQTAVNAGDWERVLALLTEAADRETVSQDGPRAAAAAAVGIAGFESALQNAADNQDWLRMLTILAAERDTAAHAEASAAVDGADADVLYTAGQALQNAADNQDWLRMLAILAKTEREVAVLRVPASVHDEGVAMLQGVLRSYEASWPWLGAAWRAAEVRFYDPSIPGASSCVQAATVPSSGIRSPQIWIRLELLRASRTPDALPSLDFEDFWCERDRSTKAIDDTLIHELAHIWSYTAADDPATVGPAWAEARAGFRDYFEGCRIAGVRTDQVAEELLADAMTMLTRGVAYHDRGSSTSGTLSIFGGYYDPDGNHYGDSYGYYDNDGFTGCLVDGEAPPEHLMAALNAALRPTDT